MSTIAIALGKGGNGKSTLINHMDRILTKYKINHLVYDLDLENEIMM
jgi:MinD superfamily P-loop ATPase